MSKLDLRFVFQYGVFDVRRSVAFGRNRPRKNPWATRIARFSIVWACLAFQPGVQSSELLFRDDFLDKTLNQTHWGVADWKLGRTQLGLKPEITQGVARLSFHTLGFMGTEIYTQRFFSRESGLEIKVRARLGKSPAGLVAGIFTYVTDSDGASDEIDIELLSKDTAVARNGLPMMLSTWRQWSEVNSDLSDVAHHWTTRLTQDGLAPFAWHEYAIRWLPDRTEWYVDQQLIAGSIQAQPDQPTRIRFNLWAPGASWAQAYSTLLMPSLSPSANWKYFFELDWVEVSRL